MCAGTRGMDGQRVHLFFAPRHARESVPVLVIHLLTLLVVTVSTARGQEGGYRELSGAVHIHTSFSTGRHTIEEIAERAHKLGIDALVITDDDLLKVEYGLPFLRGLSYARTETGVFTHSGVKQYLEEIERVDALFPELVLIAGIESAPFYFWDLSVEPLGLVLRSWNKHMTAIGLESVADYENLPVIGHDSVMVWHWSGLFLIWPLFGLIYGLAFLETQSSVLRAGIVGVSALCLIISELACAPNGPLADKVIAEGMRFVPVPSFRQELSPLKDLTAIAELLRIIRHGGYDVIHTHNSKAGFLGRLAAHLAGHPAIVHTIHGFSFHDRTSPWQRWLFIKLEQLAAKWCHRIISISDGLVQWAAVSRIEPRCPIDVIYSGIEFAEFEKDVDRTRIRHELGLSDSLPTVGIVSKLWEGKGHEDLFRAVAILKERGCRLQLLVVGEGPMERSLRSLADDLGIGRDIIFAGFRKDVPECTEAVDIATLPSHFEGMGRVLLEAMARSKPIVATRVGGIPDVVVDGSTGILVAPGNPEECAEALSRLISDPTERAAMGRRGKERLVERFSSDKMVEGTSRVYTEILAAVSQAK